MSTNGEGWLSTTKDDPNKFPSPIPNLESFFSSPNRNGESLKRELLELDEENDSSKRLKLWEVSLFPNMN